MNTDMDLSAFLQFDFLQRALEAGVLVGIAAPLLGMFLVVRRYSLLSDALSHVSLLGVALALILKIPIFFGALFLSVASALGMERLRASGRMPGESVVALFLSGSLALAVVLLSSLRGLNANIMSYHVVVCLSNQVKSQENLLLKALLSCFSLNCCHLTTQFLYINFERFLLLQVVIEFTQNYYKN